MTAKELAVIAKTAKPHVRYAYSTSDTTVAAWDNGRWAAVAGKLLDGNWAGFAGELVINGENLTDKLTFIEV